MRTLPEQPEAEPEGCDQQPKADSLVHKPQAVPTRPQNPLPVEHGGQKGPEPTRYGDWEKNGRCTDF